MPNETDLVQSCIKWVKENGGDAWHVHGSAVQRKGEPDIDGALPIKVGTSSTIVHFKIECKVGYNDLSAIQERRLAVWKRLGYVVGVARSLDEFKEIVTNGWRT